MIPVTGFEDGKDNLWIRSLRTLAHLLKRVLSHDMDGGRQESRTVAYAGWLSRAYPREPVGWYISGRLGRE